MTPRAKTGTSTETTPDKCEQLDQLRDRLEVAEQDGDQDQIVRMTVEIRKIAERIDLNLSELKIPASAALPISGRPC